MKLNNDEGPLVRKVLTCGRFGIIKLDGAVVQLGERMTGSHEVESSNLFGSTNYYRHLRDSAFHQTTWGCPLCDHVRVEIFSSNALIASSLQAGVR